MRTSVLDTPGSELVRRAIKQDQEAFRELYEFYERPLEKRLFYLVKDREVADDLYQETFISVWEYFLSPEAATSGIDQYFDKWVYRVARNLAFDHLRRKKKVEFTYLPEAFEVEGHEDLICDLIWLNEAVEAMSPKYKVCFVLQVYQGYSQREIAMEIGITESTVSANVSRARGHLNDLYVTLNAALERVEVCWRQSVTGGRGVVGTVNQPWLDGTNIDDCQIRSIELRVERLYIGNQMWCSFRIVLQLGQGRLSEAASSNTISPNQFIALEICDKE